MYLVTKACEFVKNEFDKGEDVSAIDAVQMTAKIKGMVKRCQEKINYVGCEVPVIRQMLIATGAPAYPVPPPGMSSPRMHMDMGKGGMGMAGKGGMGMAGPLALPGPGAMGGGMPGGKGMGQP